MPAAFASGEVRICTTTARKISRVHELPPREELAKEAPPRARELLLVMVMKRGPTFAAILVVALVFPGRVDARGERIVTLYENRSGNPDGVELVASSVAGVLARKGYEVIEGGEVTDFQEAMRISRADPLPQGVANRILLRFHADVLLSVVINFVLPAKARTRGPRANPAIGLTARMILQDGSIRWRNSMGIIADDSALSSGRDNRAGAIRTTVVMGCERLLYALPRAKQSLLEEPVDDLPLVSPAARRGGPKFPLKPAPDPTKNDDKKKR
jgi:hypothetical protein